MNEKMQTTVGWLQWRRFYEEHMDGRNLKVFRKCRDFYDGNHYKALPEGIPAPCVNIVAEFVDKFQAKMCGTKHYVSFVADMGDEDLTSLDQFYETQMLSMGDDQVTALAVAEAAKVGTSFVITAFDEDTWGTKGKYRGFLKRRLVKVEDFFVADVHRDDLQDQAYLGYVEAMDLDSARALIEEENEKTRKAKEKLVCRDDYEMPEAIDDPKYTETDKDRCTVITRFFRIAGEVWCETSTKYAVLSLHALNPSVTRKDVGEEGFDWKERKAPEYRGVDPAKVVAYSKAKALSDSTYAKEKGKFSRYPVSVYRPWPIPNLLWGLPKVGSMIRNQQYVDYVYLLVMLIIQSHSSPMYLVKPDSLKGQVISNSPNEVITDYSYSGANQWGITRMGSGDGINTSLLAVGAEMIKTTRSVFGFDNLSSNFTADTSGYAYQMITKQMDLTLEIPQLWLWDYFRQNAKTDLMWFRHYLEDEESFFVKRSEAELMKQSEAKRQVEGMMQAGAVQAPEGMDPASPLPLSRYLSKKISRKVFDGDFDISVDVMQGIEGSAITEAQHFQQMFQLASSGNMRPDYMLAWLMADPQFTQKERSVIKTAFEAAENGRIQELTDMVEQYKGVINQLMQKLQQMQGLNQVAQKQVQAVRKSAQDQSNAQNAMIRTLASASEGAVKSNNARGIEGTSFQQGTAQPTIS